MSVIKKGLEHCKKSLLVFYQMRFYLWTLNIEWNVSIIIIRKSCELYLGCLCINGIDVDIFYRLWPNYTQTHTHLLDVTVLPSFCADSIDPIVRFHTDKLNSVKLANHRRLHNSQMYANTYKIKKKIKWPKRLVHFCYLVNCSINWLCMNASVEKK